MADLTITLNGDSADFKKQFDQAIQSLKKFSDSTKEGQGYISGMEANMKLLKTQLRSASEQDIPALRTQFLNLRTSIREAQYGTETFTKKIGNEFDIALQKANKNLFSLTNLAKGLTAGFGIGAIASQFIQATGAADALDRAIQGVVTGLKNLDKTQLEIDLGKSTLPLIEKARAYIGGLQPVDERLTTELDKEIAKLSDKMGGTRPQTLFEKEQGLIPKPWTPDEIARMQEEIRLLEEARASIIALKNVANIKGGGAGGGVATVSGLSPLEIALQNEPAGWNYNQSAIDAMNQSALGIQDFGANADSMQNRINARKNQDWINDYFAKQEDAIDKLVRHEEQMRAQSMDRIGARIGQTAEDALSAGLRGGFQDFLQNYMQQTGLRLFSGLLRLAFSSATGGSFGTGNLLGHIFGFAGGGEFYTRGPMPIMVGDNPGGVEKVTVEPISGKGTSGLKNGNLALAGGGSVMSAPLSGGGGNTVYEITLELDKVNLGKVLYQPNGVIETVNRMRANPV